MTDVFFLLLVGRDGRAVRNLRNVKMENADKNTKRSHTGSVAGQRHHRSGRDRVRKDGRLRHTHSAGAAGEPSAVFRARFDADQRARVPDIGTDRSPG